MSAAAIPFVEPVDSSWRMNPSKVSVVRAVGRRMVPYVIEATLIPTVLFYAFLITFELKWAIVAALGWTYAALGRRIVSGRPIPGLLVLATLGISVRTVDLPPQWQRLRVLLPADHAHGGHRRHVRPLRAHRPAAHRPVRIRLLPAQP